MKLALKNGANFEILPCVDTLLLGVYLYKFIKRDFVYNIVERNVSFARVMFGVIISFVFVVKAAAAAAANTTRRSRVQQQGTVEANSKPVM